MSDELEEQNKIEMDYQLQCGAIRDGNLDLMRETLERCQL